MTTSANILESNHFNEEETYLRESLRIICDENGKEGDPKLAAEIFHKLGLLYQDKGNKLQNKICLIQSATLLNAAVARQPNNEKFRSDLEAFCFNVLSRPTAGVKKQNADLLKISNKTAEEIKHMRKIVLRKMRKNFPRFTAFKPKHRREQNFIKRMESIQENIGQMYTKIMKNVFNECIKLFEGLPCKFAIAGLGSLARNEITPYSDFEHIILLENGIEDHENYSKIHEQFRWFSLIFLIILINLQETIIPSVAIPSLNDYTTTGGNWFYDAYTTRGITLDGLMAHACKNPLGRPFETKDKPWITELIQPVNKMLEYLKPDVSLKNGYHLGEILLQSCYVSGDKDVYEQFKTGINRMTKENKLSSHSQMMQELDEDLKNFDAFTDLMHMRETTQCNIKRVIYRSVTLFVSALGRMYGIDEASSFSILKSLKENKIIEDEITDELNMAVAVACKVRLSRYMEQKSQKDHLKSDANDEDHVSLQLTKYVKMEQIVRYFVTALSLQKVIRGLDYLKLPDNLVFDTKLLLKYMVAYKLGYYDYVILQWKMEKNCPSSSDVVWIKYYVGRAHARKESWEKAVKVFKAIETENGYLKFAISANINAAEGASLSIPGHSILDTVTDQPW
ncbi:unnamed protein product [Clavelina lepadiformis]|uniref:Protein-PII uridylyltransferase N-terminal domain-containing protein n=1 Tax=Clavelina lepadiformis TaxID=159417 RepID=A0ABP0FNU5_CLALP